MADETLQQVGAWFSQLLGATEEALEAVGLPPAAAARLIQALARRGYMIDADPAFGVSENSPNTEADE